LAVGDFAKFCGLIALLTLSCNAQETVPAGWKQFRSDVGFVVSYPSTWFRIGTASKDRLQILTSEGGAEGIVIKRGQAELMVRELEGSRSRTLAQVIKRDTSENSSIQSRRDLWNRKVAKDECGSFTEVVSQEEAVPSKDVPVHVPPIINTDFYCEINGRKFSILAKNWEGDKRQQYYQHVALQVARTLRVTN
jgi:hypothetical protein